ncbi:MAG: SWIM zinc finger domain-containing protein [Candidatus Sabulitectum sp.]|nr:SWIM zinc finger domain-containing protein [Candidatus Sabulitectum sp.]
MMEKKKDSFTGLTWNGINDWAGDRIASRGRSYQKNGYVSDLAVTVDGDLIAWVDGTHRYATKVSMNEKSGLPDSVCSCPYKIDCKHGVAVVLEYLKCVEENRDVPKARENDERLEFVEIDGYDDEFDDDDDESLPVGIRKEITSFLKKKTKAQLIELFLDLTERHPEVRQELADSKQLASGDTSGILKQLRREISEMGSRNDLRDPWENDIPSPDFSRIRNKLTALLTAGHADEVLSLGKELIAEGKRLMETCDDEGDAGMEVSECYPVIVLALEQSSLEPVDRLEWAVNAVLDDEYDLCDVFLDYLHQTHNKNVWNLLSDRLLSRLSTSSGNMTGRRDYQRDHLSSMIISSLEQSGRISEIIPLCKIEAELTGSYERLVGILIEDHQYKEAEKWIVKGIRDIGRKLPGIECTLRRNLREIRTLQKNWPSVAAIQINDFVGCASENAYAECKKSSDRADIWPQVREHLLVYLETGAIPWKQKNWSLPKTVLPAPDSKRDKDYPMIKELIDVAIFEKNPERILYWYDRLPEKRYMFNSAIDDRIAEAVADYAPERAVAIWQEMAESQIAVVKPKAYKVAARYLRKAERVMVKQKKSADWEQYLQELRRIHARKLRFIEILNGLEKKLIIKGKG